MRECEKIFPVHPLANHHTVTVTSCNKCSKLTSDNNGMFVKLSFQSRNFIFLFLNFICLLLNFSRIFSLHKDIEIRYKVNDVGFFLFLLLVNQ